MGSTVPQIYGPERGRTHVSAKVASAKCKVGWVVNTCTALALPLGTMPTWRARWPRMAPACRRHARGPHHRNGWAVAGWAALNRPSSCTIYDLGETPEPDSQQFNVMEWLEGPGR